MDEQKEPNFLAAKTAVVEGDDTNAVELFEKALTVNPHSASAHYELACLYDSKLMQPADAIYHYSRYLKYSPNAVRMEGTNVILSDKAQLVQQRINSCKLEVAKTVSSLGPLTSAAQREMERLTQENRILSEKIEGLQKQLVQYQTANGTVHGRSARNNPLLDTSYQSTTPAPQPDMHAVPEHRDAIPAPHSEIHTTPLPPVRDIPTPRTPSNGGKRTHVVHSGETPAAIARIYSIPVNSLLAANPQIRPTHLVVGQTLVIPPH